MGLRGRDSDTVNKVTSTSLSKELVQREDEPPRPTSARSHTESIRSRVKKTDPVCTARNKDFPVSPRLLTEEDVDLDKQLGKGSLLSAGDYDSMWLSSGCLSPSAFFEEHKLSSPFHHVADEWLVSWLSTLADTYVSLSKGTSLSNSSNSKPEEDKLYALAKAVSSGKLLEGGLEGESTSDSNNLMSLSTNPDTTSQVLDMDKTGFMVSSNTELDLDYVHSRLPSPSCKDIWGSDEVDPTISTTINREDGVIESNNMSSEQTSEAENMEDLSGDEPLFWPFDRKVDWNSEETWKYFSMSPRKETMKVTTPEQNDPNRCRKNLILNSGSTASNLLELKQGSKGYNNNSNDRGSVKRGSTKPSRLRESRKNSAKIVPLDIDNPILPLSTTKSVLTSKNLWEDDFTTMEELPIETVLGLGEFDGHEGIDPEFSEEIFLFDEAL
ncbi:hypothetical protein PTKIN_Ptkin17bG0039700 [Pterospermum kingtungense]